MDTMIKKMAVTVTTILFTGLVAAQTSDQINLAKSLAKQYGYSDSEIESMMSSYGVTSSSSNVDLESSDGKTKTNTLTNQTNTNLRSRYLKTGSKIMTVDGQEIKFSSREDSLEFATFLDFQAYQEYKQKNFIDGFLGEEEEIYGHGLFKISDLSFIPSYNIPTPTNYRLCPGDKLIVDVWGASYLSDHFIVSPEGTITMKNVGPITVGGHTVAEAEEIVKHRLSATYAGLVGDAPNTFLRVALGEMRSFVVNVVGEVESPGSYSIPSLSNLFSILYLAGGPSKMGNVRDIRLYRHNKLIVKLDIYDFLVKGDFSKNIRLEDDDLIKIEPYDIRVKATGAVKRRMSYDIKEGESLADLIKYTAGFADNANTGNIQVIRRTGERTESFDVQSSDFASFKLMDGDSVYVAENISDNRNLVNVSGAVWLPGNYALSEESPDLRAMLEKAGGLREDAHKEWGIIVRVDEKHDTLVLHFNASGVVAGKQDIPLQNRDHIHIFSKQDLYRSTPIVTKGELNNPRQLTYRKGITLGDVVLLSGGFTDLANLQDVRIARRNVDDNVFQLNPDTSSIVCTYDIRNDPESLTEQLKPYDVVIVGRVPNYRNQTIVTVKGEVAAPGAYVLDNKDVKVSDLLARAGGFTNRAYPRGCRVERTLTQLEKERLERAMKFAALQLRDTSAFAGIDVNDSFTVGIDIDKVMKEPGSYADLLLRDGDILIVPEYNPVVRISGAVSSANVTAFVPGVGYRGYISQAGGYIQRARKRGVYIQYANGNISTRKSPGGLKPAPGCEIIVPRKGDAHKWTPAEIMSLTTSAVSLSTMIVSLVNLIKK